MSEQDIKNKNLVLIDYLRSNNNGYKIKAEYSTNLIKILQVNCCNKKHQEKKKLYYGKQIHYIIIMM